MNIYVHDIYFNTVYFYFYDHHQILYKNNYKYNLNEERAKEDERERERKKKNAWIILAKKAANKTVLQVFVLSFAIFFCKRLSPLAYASCFFIKRNCHKTKTKTLSACYTIKLTFFKVARQLIIYKLFLLSEKFREHSFHFE